MHKIYPVLLSSALVLPVLAPAPLLAQEDDRSWLTAFLEDSLSDAGRKVTITGFTGALSSRATIRQLTIADDKGIWLELDDIVLDWSRSALLSGQFIVNELSAERVILTRIPDSDEDALPSPEARPFDFALPELPVSIDIGLLRAGEVSLGESVLGQALRGHMEAEIHLSGGEGTAKVRIERQDEGPEGLISADASYSNATRELLLDIAMKEGADGIVANALDLPGRPAAELSLNGRGRIDEFKADFALETDGQPRLSGPITVEALPDGTGRAFSARLSGNPAPLFLPEYAGFLGEHLSLDLVGASHADGRLTLDRFALDARALRLNGRLALASDGLPERIILTGAIAHEDGEAVLLPISGPVETRVNRADLTLNFDAQKDSRWRFALSFEGLDRSDMRIAEASLRGTGNIDRLQDMAGVNGKLTLTAKGLAARDPALQSALGPQLAGQVDFDWRQGSGALRLSDMALRGEDYDLAGRLAISGFEKDFATDLDFTVNARDLSRFSSLAGRAIGGEGRITLSGTANPLSGGFALDLDLRGKALRTGIAEADQVLKGESVVIARAVRDETGLTLDSLDVTAASLKLSASGKLSTDNGNSLIGRVDWGQISDLGAGYGGRLAADVSYSDMPSSPPVFTLEGTTRDLRVRQPEADKLLAGDATLKGRVILDGKTPRIELLNLNARNVTADVTGEGTDGALQVTARLRDLGLFLPEFPGALTLSGRLSPQGDGYQADLALQGPAAINSRLTGLLSPSRPDVGLVGTSVAALVNGFTDPVTLAGNLSYNLRLNGWTLASLSGQASLARGRIAIPARGLTLENMAASANMSGGSVQVTGSAELPRGGQLRLSGPINLTAPYPATLSLQIDRAHLRDPELYDTFISGQIAINGPLMGAAMASGQLTLGETELRVPSTGFATSADLEKIRHVGDRAEVKGTRASAGVSSSAGRAGASRPASRLNWGLDIAILAPNHVFIRGRGLDAELSGSVRIGGTINNPIPSGGLNLVRGRLDILGKRLELETADLTLEGDFNPSLNVRASNVTEEVTSFVTIEGPANAPKVEFSSEPELPQEEILAWMLFGRGLDKLSAFQAAQLASAVATLAGRGGEGIVSKLRKGFGFDDLDVNTSEEGSTSIKVGKYLSKNVYTEVGVDQEGNSRINLNLDIRKGLTAKARVDSTGDSGIGIFLEKDY